MATLDDLRRIALALPGCVEAEDGMAFSVEVKGKPKGFAWAWNERVDPKKARVRNPGVFAVRVPGLTAKDTLIESDPEKFFTEPHYNGYPAVLVRLDAVSVEELEDAVVEAWRTLQPPARVRKSAGGSRR